LHKSWCQVTLVATFFMLGTQFGMCFRWPLWCLEFWSGT
jgi:hypothetical protein